jgi:hypothetical protein
MADAAKRHMLRQHYRTYLENGANARHAAPLAAALASRGFPEEGELLQAFSQHGPGSYRFRSSTFPGQRAYVGPRPPVAFPGDWWMDSCDLSLNILLPQLVDPEDWEAMTEEAKQRTKANLSWFAARPVMTYQFAAFLDVAPIERASSGRVSLDSAMRDADERHPVTNLTTNAAGCFLYWFGKSFANDMQWMSVRDNFGLSPWSEIRAEWIGESAFNSSYCVAISADTLGTDPQNTEGEANPKARMLFDPSEAHADITFRSSLRLAYGLRTSNVPTPLGECGARVLGRFGRPRA